MRNHLMWKRGRPSSSPHPVPPTNCFSMIGYPRPTKDFLWGASYDLQQEWGDRDRPQRGEGLVHVRIERFRFLCIHLLIFKRDTVTQHFCIPCDQIHPIEMRI